MGSQRGSFKGDRRVFEEIKIDVRVSKNADRKDKESRKAVGEGGGGDGGDEVIRNAMRWAEYFTKKPREFLCTQGEQPGGFYSKSRTTNPIPSACES